MATLHKEYINFDKEIKLTPARKESLKGSRKELRRKIRNWFRENKPYELQPDFEGQGSFEMNTTINPIPEYDDKGNKLLKYDLDDGVYFIEKKVKIIGTLLIHGITGYINRLKITPERNLKGKPPAFV